MTPSRYRSTVGNCSEQIAFVQPCDHAGTWQPVQGEFCRHKGEDIERGLFSFGFEKHTDLYRELYVNGLFCTGRQDNRGKCDLQVLGERFRQVDRFDRVDMDGGKGPAQVLLFAAAPAVSFVLQQAAGIGKPDSDIGAGSGIVQRESAKHVMKYIAKVGDKHDETGVEGPGPNTGCPGNARQQLVRKIRFLLVYGRAKLLTRGQ